MLANFLEAIMHLRGNDADVGSRIFGGAQTFMEPIKPTLPVFVTVEEFATIARLSRRQIDRLRKRRPPGFPTE